MTEWSDKIERLNSFVKKFNDNRFVYPKNLNSDQQEILKDLVNAVDSFENAYEERKPRDPIFDRLLNSRNPRVFKYNYDTAVSNLSKLIKIAEISGLLIDPEKEDPPAIKTLKDLNTKLINQENQLRTVLDDIFEKYPKIKENYQPLLGNVRVEEGKVD